MKYMMDKKIEIMRHLYIEKVIRLVGLIFTYFVVAFYTFGYSSRLFVKKIFNLSIINENMKLNMQFVLFCVLFLSSILVFLNEKISMVIKIKLGNKKKKVYIDQLYRRICDLFCIIMIVLGMFILGDAIREAYIINLQRGNCWNGDTLIAHAGGSIDGNIYTNCLEAIEKSYDNGIRVFELDFAYTSDGHMVCKHDWEYAIQEGNEPGEIWDRDTFLAVPIYDKYTPIDITVLCEFMLSHSDAYIITDTKDTDYYGVKRDFSSLIDDIRAKGYDEVLDRFVIQIYNDDMYDTVNEIYPFKNWIYTLYTIWGGNVDEFENIARFCYQKGIQGITCWYYLASDDVLSIADSYGIKMYVHTVNDVDEAKALLKKKIRGIYTDDILPGNLEE